MAAVFSLVVVGVSDQGALPVVVQVAVGDGNEVLLYRKLPLFKITQVTYRSSSNINKSIIKVLVMVSIGTQIYMVDPDVRGAKDSDCILEGRGHFLVYCIADDNVGRVDNGKTNTDYLFIRQAALTGAVANVTYCHFDL